MAKDLRLLNLRTTLNMKQHEIAELLGVNRVTYCRWELGTMPIPARRMKALRESTSDIAALRKAEAKIVKAAIVAKLAVEPLVKPRTAITDHVFKSQIDILALPNVDTPEKTMYWVPTQLVNRSPRQRGFACLSEEAAKYIATSPVYQELVKLGEMDAFIAQIPAADIPNLRALPMPQVGKATRKFCAYTEAQKYLAKLDDIERLI